MTSSCFLSRVQRVFKSPFHRRHKSRVPPVTVPMSTSEVDTLIIRNDDETFDDLHDAVIITTESILAAYNNCHDMNGQSSNSQVICEQEFPYYARLHSNESCESNNNTEIIDNDETSFVIDDPLVTKYLSFITTTKQQDLIQSSLFDYDSMHYMMPNILSSTSKSTHGEHSVSCNDANRRFRTTAGGQLILRRQTNPTHHRHTTQHRHPCNNQFFLPDPRWPLSSN